MYWNGFFKTRKNFTNKQKRKMYFFFHEYEKAFLIISKQALVAFLVTE